MEPNVHFYSYRKLWKHEKKLYAIQNFRLWAPVSGSQILYVALGLLTVWLLSKLLPGIDKIPEIARYGIFPYMVMKFLTTIKLDGKNPLRFFGDYLIYLLIEKGKYMEHFRLYSEKEAAIKLKWFVGRGERKNVL